MVDFTSKICPRCQAAIGGQCLEAKRDGQRYSVTHIERVYAVLEDYTITVNAATWKQVKLAIYTLPLATLSELMERETAEPQPKV